jgi:hypothetical protein
MMCFLTNPIVQIMIGATISFAGSVYANYLFVDKRLKNIEVQKAYNRLVDAVVRLEKPPDPTGLLPLELADRADDLRFALRLKNEKFHAEVLIQKAIKQAADILKQRKVGGAS